MGPMSLLPALLPQGSPVTGGVPTRREGPGSRCVIAVSGPAGPGTRHQATGVPGASPLHTVPPAPSLLYSPFGSKLSEVISFSVTLRIFANFYGN